MEMKPQPLPAIGQRGGGSFAGIALSPILRQKRKAKIRVGQGFAFDQAADADGELAGFEQGQLQAKAKALITGQRSGFQIAAGVGQGAHACSGMNVARLEGRIAAVERRITPFYEGLRGRRVAIKQALLAGDVVVGVGNIYCSEALFGAGIDPRTPAARVGPRRCERLVDSIRRVLHQAVATGGSTLRDFHDAHGMGGAFQAHARVYDRAGLPCLACGTSIRRIVQGQRATYFCPICQRR